MEKLNLQRASANLARDPADDQRESGHGEGSPKMSETPAEYLARIGAKGGAKSRRKLSKKEARRIAKVRWQKPGEGK